MSRFFSREYASLEEYVPGEQPLDKQYIKLNTNESPYPPSASVIAAVNASEVEKLCLYSDPTSRLLKQEIANVYGVSSENVFVSNGSDDILNFAFMAFGKDNGVIFPDITYGFYKVFAELHHIDAKIVPLEEDFSIDLEAYKNAGRMVVIANPNAPTGMAHSVSALEAVVRSNPDTVVLIDEAYVDFGAESMVPLIEKYDNLLVVETFSKSRSMAGARLGFAFASAALIRDLEKIKYSTNPYNVNRLTQAAGAAAMRENDYYMENCKKIIETRAFTSEKLRELGFTVLPSSANFVFAKHNEVSGEDIYLALKEKGVLVRHFTSERIKDFNRITIGTREEMEKMISLLSEILKK